jgi:23S rRNA pseudouridine2605 synthase
MRSVVPRTRLATVPLARALSKLGLASRTEARALILAGRVTVDGRAVDDPQRPVVPERARIAIDGEVRARPPLVAIVLNKPRGVVTTRRDPEGRATVYDLVQDLGVHVSAVGRLDRASSGLLILTNSTRLADALTDPARAVPRVYAVTVRGAVSDETCARSEAGLVVGGERLVASRMHVRKRSQRETHLTIELHEGRNREIRRLLAALGHEVTRLTRVSFGSLALGSLETGRWRRLEAAEVSALERDAGVKPGDARGPVADMTRQGLADRSRVR